MPKRNTKFATKLVAGAVLKEIQSCRPLRLFIKKQRKKGNDDNPLTIRSKFVQLSPEKKLKYYQKAIDKYTQLLDEKDINEHVQIEGQLLDHILTKKEQRLYFQSLDPPTKPLYSAAAYYSDSKKNENDPNAKPWKSLSAEERKPYIQTLTDAKAEYSAQVKNFAENLPDRLKCEYLSFLLPPSHGNGTEEENTNAASITQRRKSVQSIPESFKTSANDNPQKLNRSQLDDLHKCQPSIIFYEKKVADDDKPTFDNSTKKNAYIRSLFNQISEKKRHKFILKSIQKWEEYLQENPSIIEQQIPTLHLLLGKFDDIHYYFSSLGLPSRPPISANILFNNEKQQTNSQQNWADLPLLKKDEYIKRLSKLKNNYQKDFLQFVEKTLPSDYLRLEFFRNVKFAAKDYESFTKDRVKEIDDGQSKITQYLTPKKKEKKDGNEFDRIKQQLLATQLNKEQKNLVERLGQLMDKYIEETTASKKESSKISTGAKRKSPDVVIVNGDISSDTIERSGENDRKKKKRDRSENEEKTPITSSSSSTKKRK